MAEVERFASGISDIARSALNSEPGDETIRFEPADLGRLWRGDGGNDPVGALQAETRDEKVYAMLVTRTDQLMSVATAIAELASQKWRGLGKDRLWQIWGAMGKPPPTPQKPRRRTVR
ncbi:hypothetical protein [Rhodopseudomonas palustris]|uniref:hypothetical protein n=1 Tax=Rhodopseudomonas palustris TaxID=1076 RepID=UPI0011B02C9B|nr:hypothetical protein [Rhodopseudomonas palustris]